MGRAVDNNERNPVNPVNPVNAAMVELRFVGGPLDGGRWSVHAWAKAVVVRWHGRRYIYRRRRSEAVFQERAPDALAFLDESGREVVPPLTQET